MAGHGHHDDHVHGAHGHDDAHGHGGHGHADSHGHGHDHGHHDEEPKGKIKKEMIVGDLIKAYPETLAVFRKYFGALSLMLPGTRVETIEFNCAMHDQSHNPLLRELNDMLGD